MPHFRNEWSKTRTIEVNLLKDEEKITNKNKK